MILEERLWCLFNLSFNGNTLEVVGESDKDMKIGKTFIFSLGTSRCQSMLEACDEKTSQRKLNKHSNCVAKQIFGWTNNGELRFSLSTYM